MQHHKYHLREADAKDALLIGQWLRNPHDCKMAIGHAPLVYDDFRQWLDAEDQFGWILGSPEGPVGYGEIWVDEDAKDLELAHIVVNPVYRGQGYGKLLTELLYEKGTQYDFSSIFMRIYPENEAALKCYTSAGFTHVHELAPEMSPDFVWLSRSYETEI